MISPEREAQFKAIAEKMRSDERIAAAILTVTVMSRITKAPVELVDDALLHLLQLYKAEVATAMVGLCFGEGSETPPDKVIVSRLATLGVGSIDKARELQPIVQRMLENIQSYDKRQA